MNAATTLPTPLPVRVLFLSRGESSIRTDVTALRAMGIVEITHMSRADAALERLEAEYEREARNNAAGPGASRLESADIIICDEHLADAPASAFLFSLAQRPSLRARPVLVISGSGAAARQLKAAGVCVLERPYTPGDLECAVSRAMSPSRLILRAERFKSAAKQGLPLAAKPTPRPARMENAPMTTSDWLKQGMDHLKKQEPEEAERAFAEVLARQHDHMDASLGMARVCRMRDDAKGTQRHLLRAAAAGMRAGEKSRTASITAMLPARMRNNVFVYEAISLMEEEAFRPAALSFLDAGRQRPDVPLHRLISRACLLLPKPEANMEKLCDALEGLGHKSTAKGLRQRLLEYPDFTRERRPSWLDKHPLLREAVNVISYTTWAWKQA